MIAPSCNDANHPSSRKELAMPATISRDELKAKMDRGDRFTLLETLPEEYYRRSHLPGARNMPYDEVRQRAPAAVPDKSAEVVTYCMNRT
jgi:rhodanese-related sulfurtransferase